MTTDPADIVREVILQYVPIEEDEADDALDALDQLVAENRRLREALEDIARHAVPSSAVLIARTALSEDCWHWPKLQTVCCDVQCCGHDKESD
jgi:hypothetical protein